MRELVYYVATSLDGLIADSEGDFSTFPQESPTLEALFARYPETCPTPLQEALDVPSEAHRFDTVLMGYNTFKPALTAGWGQGAYHHLRQVVITHRDLKVTSGITSMSGNIVEKVQGLKAEQGADVWLCGGGNVAAQLIDLIDEIQLKLNPVVLGRGVPMLPIADRAHRFRLAAHQELPGDVLLLTYRAR